MGGDVQAVVARVKFDMCRGKERGASTSIAAWGISRTARASAIAERGSDALSETTADERAVVSQRPQKTPIPELTKCEDQ